MSVHNSEAIIQNLTQDIIQIGSKIIYPGSFMKIWDTKTAVVNRDVLNTFAEIKAYQDDLNNLISDGYVVVVHDGLHLNLLQTQLVMRDMEVLIEQNNAIHGALSTGIKLDTVKEPDGRQIITPSPIGLGWAIWFAGAEDNKEMYEIHKLNPLAPSGRGEGRIFKVDVPGDGVTVTETFNFVDVVHIHDGEINWGPEGVWSHNDYFCVGVRFPPTEVTLNMEGTGNCNLYEIADGYHMILPAAGDGYHDVDLDHAVPVPSEGNVGFWNVDPDNGAISAGLPGQSTHDLFTFPPHNVWLMKNIATANSLRTMQPESYRTEGLHPNWDILIRVTKNSPGAGWLAGWFTCFRKNVF